MEFQVVLLYLAVPGERERCVGVFVYDAEADRLMWRLVDDWTFVKDDCVREYIESLSSEVAKLVEDLGAAEMLRYFEDSASNVLRTSDRKIMLFPSEPQDVALNQLFDCFVA